MSAVKRVQVVSTSGKGMKQSETPAGHGALPVTVVLVSNCRMRGPPNRKALFESMYSRPKRSSVLGTARRRSR
jgi:hypothetical protein